MTTSWCFGWATSPSSTDAYEFFNLFRSRHRRQLPRWSNATCDQALDASLVAATEAERWALYAALEKTLCVDELPVIPLYWEVKRRRPET